MSAYPHSPGFKETGTSRDAAMAIAPTLNERQQAVLSAIERLGSATPDEVAAALDLSVLAVRPRVTELKLLGLIEKTGERRSNASGLHAAAWRVRREFAETLF